MADDAVETRVDELIHSLVHEFASLGEDLPWTLARALIHRAVHLAAENESVEFCTISTYLADMIGHAHKLSHGEDPGAQSHQNFVH